MAYSTRVAILLMIFGLFQLMQAPVFAAEKNQSLPTVSSVDLDRYLGQWFEIARLPNRFQKKCTRTTAEYQRRKDGDIRVINRCHIKGQDKVRQATGRAWVTDKASQAKLKVQFALTGLKLPFMAGKYWITVLADDYSYAVVGEPSREYLWILSRTKALPKATLDRVIKQAEKQGFPVENLIFTDALKD